MARRAVNQLVAEFDLGDQPRLESKHLRGIARELVDFDAFGKSTIVRYTHIDLADESLIRIPTFVNEFWTSRQRQAANLHEISYRACFKPQLPRFFIERLTKPGNLVYDPFMGRGTTPLEAALMGRVPLGCDVNPVATAMVGPRFAPPSIEEIEARIQEIPFDGKAELSADLLVFYHPETLAEISSLKRYLLDRRENGARDAVDDWIAMVALNRLTGHSPGFFSVYTLPPNQAVSAKAQRKINSDRDQTPPRRDVPKLILKKSNQLLKGLEDTQLKAMKKVGGRSLTLTSLAKETPEIADRSVSLVVTSPPFLDVVDYHTDNWLRCWFLGIDSKSVKITIAKGIRAWEFEMDAVFRELFRVVKPGGHVAFEVGDVKQGTVRLEDSAVRCGVNAGFEPQLILINDQKFTKTANCWGVDNNFKGTNTNRIVLFRKGK